MKMHNKFGYVVVTVIGSLLMIGCNKTPGQKLDKAIDSVHQTAQNVEKKYDEKKHEAKKKSDQAREDLANKIRPN